MLGSEICQLLRHLQFHGNVHTVRSVIVPSITVFVFGLIPILPEQYNMPLYVIYGTVGSTHSCFDIQLD
jgi:hypothetical protein